jgi:hypothetical protein
MARAACRSQLTPASRSETGIRSSAECTSPAATSGGSSPVVGKKPYATVPNASRSQWLSVKPTHASGAAIAPGSVSATHSSSARQSGESSGDHVPPCAPSTHSSS